MNFPSATKLAEVLRSDYGTGVVFAPVEAVMWASECVAESHGVDVARSDLRKANLVRAKYGAPSVSFPYGHPLF